MGSNKTNTIVLSRDNYKSDSKFYKAVIDTIKTLIDNEYILTVRWDEKGLGILAIEFGYADQSYGCAYPYWLYPEEIEQVNLDEKD